MTQHPEPTPDLASALAAIAARLDRIEARLSAIPEDGVLQRAVATAVDAADGLAARHGVDPDVRLRTLVRVADRLTDPALLDRLERLDHAAAQVPGLVATAVDTFDGLASGADDRLRALARLADRLSDPHTVALLDRLLDMAQHTPGLVATLVDSLDGLAAGLDAEGRLRALVRLLDLASQPGTAALLDQLAQHADTLPVLLRMATTTMDVATDTVLASRVPLAERVRTGFLLVERATDPETARRLLHALDGLAVLDELLVSGALDPGAVRVIGHAATALRETSSSPSEPVGLFGLLGALGDRSVRRALGFFLAVLRRLGARLTQE
jgi:uncharacterized protein YjgD (DUF1641 family)